MLAAPTLTLAPHLPLLLIPAEDSSSILRGTRLARRSWKIVLASRRDKERRGEKEGI